MSDKEDRAQVQQIEAFEQALRHAHDDVWWRKFIETIHERRASFVEALVSGTMDQRTEDRCRGQISELNFILGLDAYAEAQNGRSGRETNGR